MVLWLAANTQPSMPVKNNWKSDPLPSVIFIPLKVCLRHCIGLTLEHSSLAQSHSYISALWHSWSIYKQTPTHESTVIRITRQHESKILGAVTAFPPRVILTRDSNANNRTTSGSAVWMMYNNYIFSKLAMSGIQKLSPRSSCSHLCLKIE